MKYEVTFVVVEEDKRRKWTATYVANNFADAERQALRTLEMNGDTHSEIEKIEVW